MVLEKKVVFTVDLEDWNHALHITKGSHTSIYALRWLLILLNFYKIQSTFYVLKQFEREYPGIVEEIGTKHVLKTHGDLHYRGEKADRNPYAWLGFTGGFWFRFLPYWLVKLCILQKGECYFHPHDFDENHPKVRNIWFNWKRHVGLKRARKKLERLLQEIEWRKL